MWAGSPECTLGRGLEEEPLRSAALPEEVLLVEALLSEAELSAAEKLLPPLPAACQHRGAQGAKMVERTFSW